jgi:hypothetical protein
MASPLTSYRQVPAGPPPEPGSSDNTSCNVITSKFRFRRDFGLNDKSQHKTKKYTPSLTNSRRLRRVHPHPGWPCRHYSTTNTSIPCHFHFRHKTQSGAHKSEAANGRHRHILLLAGQFKTLMDSLKCLAHTRLLVILIRHRQFDISQTSRHHIAQAELD